ncbi:hypothetical protein D5S19_09560 [Amycolatopsis panacis]|uniref:Uncharacterized protein n=1 Tax=Amycolatopsis panacis TaxID=2340917 RepID=A0A419I726_9PSEU|nr:hypothetical protein D5S19_09560 [Amycolatopsis panacis]
MSFLTDPRLRWISGLPPFASDRERRLLPPMRANRASACETRRNAAGTGSWLLPPPEEETEFGTADTPEPALRPSASRVPGGADRRIVEGCGLRDSRGAQNRTGCGNAR